MADNEKKSPEHIAKILFDARLVTIFGEINMELAQKVVAQLWALSEINNDPIKIVINSPGGHVEAGDTIYDMIKFIKPKVKILGTGWVASAGALIYVAAEKEDRYSLPNTRFLIHQPLGSAQGSAIEFDIQARQIIRMKERLNRIFATETGQPFDRVVKDAERDYWLFAKEAKEYGLVHKIINHQHEF